MAISLLILLTMDFYPRPPRGGRRKVMPVFNGSETISIHALREEGDLISAGVDAGEANFYPRPPRGGRHSNVSIGLFFDGISIHALREEGDFTVDV